MRSWMVSVRLFVVQHDANSPIAATSFAFFDEIVSSFLLLAVIPAPDLTSAILNPHPVTLI